MKTRTLRWSVILVLAVALAGCRPAWEIALSGPAGVTTLHRESFDALSKFVVDVEGEAALPLERLLVTNGYALVDQVVFTDETGQQTGYDWATVAEDATCFEDGRVRVAGEEHRPTAIDVIPSALLSEVAASITDIVPTAALALELPAPAEATGRALTSGVADHVFLIFLDGFGYVRYTEALAGGLIPNLAALDPPLLGLTTYPPMTSGASASLLTGAPPEVHGVDQRGIRKTQTETIFDLAAAFDRSAAAVEGGALAFNLRAVDFTLSGDRDDNGSTDDNVLANALEVLNGPVPELFFVHFHGIDDAGHTYGPGAPEEEAAIRYVDGAVGQILAAMPPDTLGIIFADHGMHLVDEEGRLGNHGHLIERDMLIPIFIIAPR